MLEVFLALLTFRITIMLCFERGPASVFLRLRKKLGVMYDEDNLRIIGKKGWVAELITCAWCTSVWIGFGVTIVFNLPLWYGLALSGATIILVEKGV